MLLRNQTSNRSAAHLPAPGPVQLPKNQVGPAEPLPRASPKYQGRGVTPQPVGARVERCVRRKRELLLEPRCMLGRGRGMKERATIGSWISKSLFYTKQGGKRWSYMSGVWLRWCCHQWESHPAGDELAHRGDLVLHILSVVCRFQLWLPTDRLGDLDQVVNLCRP